MSTPAVLLDAVTHRYGAHVALDALSLEVPAGRRWALLGPNGGGKTTLFRILSTLMAPSEGRARVFGHDVVEDPEAVRRALGMVFQQPALDAELTVLENLRIHGALYGMPRRELDERLPRLLAALHMTDRAGDRVKTLSGGLQRRADLVRGLLHRPRLLLLDEPTTGLDPVARRTFWEAIDTLCAGSETTVLLATHLLDEAEACDGVAILDRGRLAAVGAPDDLRDAVGGDTLWLAADDPRALARDVEARFGHATQVIDGVVRIEHDRAHTLVGALYGAFAGRITSATVRRPTLEDVFLLNTGYRLDASPEPSAAVDGRAA